jgi:TorA maturation chaperone TorD
MQRETARQIAEVLHAAYVKSGAIKKFRKYNKQRISEWIERYLKRTRTVSVVRVQRKLEGITKVILKENQLPISSASGNVQAVMAAVDTEKLKAALRR